MKNTLLNLALIVSSAILISGCNKDDNDFDITTQESNSMSYKSELYPIEVDEKTGFINNDGEIVIEPRFDAAYNFYYGLAVFRMKNSEGWYDHYGYINTKGEIVIEHTLNSACRFSEDGLARASKNGKDGYINKKGEIVFETHYESNGDFQEGLASVKISGKWGFINTSGTLVIEPIYKSVSRFCNGYCKVTTTDGMTNYIDNSGNLISKLDIEKGDWFYCGLAKVKIGDTYNYLKGDGQLAFSKGFVEATSFSEGLAAVKKEKDGKWGFINTQGELILDYKYEAGWFGSLAFHEGLACVKEDKLWGYINKQGTYVISPRFITANKFVNGVARVYLQEKSAAYINTSGQIIYKGKID